MRQIIRNVYDIEGHKFAYVCRVAPKSDPQDRLIEVYPQAGYANQKGLNVHRYGHGPFCVFSIEREWEGKAGVYAFLVDGVVKYVGECEDLGKRMNVGYGNISPRNCFQGGQQTNCRINNLILEAVKRGSEIVLLFRQSDQRHDLESVLLKKLSPDWNRSGARLRPTFPKRDRPVPTDTYHHSRNTQSIWDRIEAHAGETFSLIRGGRFKYSVYGGHVRPDRTNQQIPRSHFEEAVSMVPLENTACIQHLRGPSYIYAILMDKRIRESD